jgi:hypothetical protein
MNRSLLLSLCVLIVSGSWSNVWGQAGFRLPVLPAVPRLPPPIIPHQSEDDKDIAGSRSPQMYKPSSQTKDPPIWVLIIVGLMVTLWMVGFSYAFIEYLHERRRPAQFIQIVATPPGEAPEEIRAAWVGLKLPLSRASPQPRQLPVTGVASGRTCGYWRGYLVAGHRAVELLAMASPEAAAWWRLHAPHVLEKGYQLVFPVEVCQRLEDKTISAECESCPAGFMCHPDGTVEDVRPSMCGPWHQEDGSQVAFPSLRSGRAEKSDYSRGGDHVASCSYYGDSYSTSIARGIEPVAHDRLLLRSTSRLPRSQIKSRRDLPN